MLLWALPVLLAVTVHEVSHGYAARHFGDPTAAKAGRLTLNPFAHIDPLGTVVVPLVLYIMSEGQYTFGWAKPVPVNTMLLRHPKADMLWVALAGPFSNLLMALFWSGLFALTYLSAEGSFGAAAARMATAGAGINSVLFIFNLFPIPPLDGGRIMVSLLPDRLSHAFARIEPFGFMIVALLLFSGALNSVLSPLLRAFLDLLVSLFGLNG